MQIYEEVLFFKLRNPPTPPPPPNPEKQMINSAYLVSVGCGLAEGIGHETVCRHVSSKGLTNADGVTTD